MKSLSILGIRGVPAAHGGFETFAEYLSLYLVSKGWRVTVYCQEGGKGPIWLDDWRGVSRVHIPVSQAGPLGTVVFDLKATVHAARLGNPCLTLGYNTALFSALLRIKSIPNIINMDGIEWARAKWGPVAKVWFWVNERLGCWLGNHLVADHPEIKEHLSTRVRAEKITTIAYGAERISDASVEPLRKLGLTPGKFVTLIARAEPENSILEVVQGFSKRKRNIRLVVLGNYSESHPYQKSVMDAASEEVMFVGAIYDKTTLHSLRRHCLAYIHGHQVGGTNPSLVEALGAGNAIIAHDNRFNRWVAGEGALYFSDSASLDVLLDHLDEEGLAKMRQSSSQRFADEFTWDRILSMYESLLVSHQ